MLPQQINPSKQADTAIAPYNFVPLPNQLVDFDPQNLPDQDSYGAGRYTGTIECRLTTETPLFVRAPLTLEQYKQLDSVEDKQQPYTKRIKNHPDFFYTHSPDSPLIPGSSLRGMLRSMVEMIGHGKFEDVTNRKLVYRAVGDTTSHGEHYRDQIMEFDEASYDENNKRYRAYTPKVKAGYLIYREGEWMIQPAKTIGGTTFARVHQSLLERLPNKLERVGNCKNAAHLYIQPGPYEHQLIRGGHIRVRFAKVLRVAIQDSKGLIKGVLAKSGEINSKRTEAVVYPLDPNAKTLTINDAMLADYRDQISQEQQKLLGEEGLLTRPSNTESNNESDPSDGFAVHRQPVFYLLDENNELLFFGHTMMMRLPYKQSPYDLVPAFLRNSAQIDLAEALFGYSKAEGIGKSQAYASRIFVGDARVEPNQRDLFLSEQAITPKILASPKLTAFQHYLVQQQPDAQEIGRNRAGEAVYQKFLSDYAESPDKSTLRGYKFYWHKQGPVSLQMIEEPADRRNEIEKYSEAGKRGVVKRDSQYTLMKPIKAGVKFSFHLRFENLAKHELGALLWALQLPGATGQTYRHKLGMGKAFGMGTIHLEPTLHLEDRQSRYGQLFDEQEGAITWHTGRKEADAGEAINDFITAFERDLLDRLESRGLQHLHQLERIQILLKLLEWPGPPNENTRYLEIEHPHPNLPKGKINEYKGRPVLPAPIQTSTASRKTAPSINRQPIATPVVANQPPAAEQAAAAAFAEEFLDFLRNRKEQPPATQSAMPQQPMATSVSKPASKEEIKPGMLLEGTVVRVEPSRVVVNIGLDEASLVKEEVVPSVRDAADLGERFPIHSTVRVYVKRINEKGRVQLTQRRIQA